MLLYPANIETKLGFDKIKHLLIERCTSTLGKGLVSVLEPLNDPQKIEILLDQTWEQKMQLVSGDAFPELRGFDLSLALDHASIEGYQLEAEVLFQLKGNLDLVDIAVRYFLKLREEYTLWAGESQNVPIPEQLRARLDQVLDSHGEVKDSASAELKRLRREIGQSESKARRSLESILGKARSDGYTEKESALTLRDGRLVLPMHAEYKRKIKGVIVDESATGKTVYLEPLEVFNLNNSIRELQFAEKREINKILQQLTASIAPYKEDIMKCQSFLGHLDFTRAKARLAVTLEATRPSVGASGGFQLKEARHPLLQLAHEKQELPVIPLDLTLDDNTRVVIISGPNAGGKSVCLKTVGLLQLMGQSGLLLPAHETSTLGCFTKIFVDIGDEQSIENDLSTYSSHLKNMNQFVRGADVNSLFLIDEFGSGTEPQFGGPIAQAILDYLVDTNAFGVATTHYSNLKKFAEEKSGVVNAAMRFDLEQLVPLYQLELGRPGSSFALEIAAKTGMPEQILDQAKASIGADPVAFEKLVSELELAKQQHLQESTALEELKSGLQEQQFTYDQLHQELKEQKRSILNEAKLEAQQLLSQANQKIESTIRAIKENRADKGITQAVRKDLERFQKQVKPELPAPQTSAVISGPIEIGDTVQIDGGEAKGEVLAISKKWAEVRLGGLKSKIKLNRLQKIAGKSIPNKQSTYTKGVNLYQNRAHYSSELDVRGLRGDAALKAVTNFVDEGIMLGMKDLRIIHGKGDGILRQLIRNYLQEEHGVQSFEDETMQNGGDGVTLVALN